MRVLKFLLELADKDKNCPMGEVPPQQFMECMGIRNSSTTLCIAAWDLFRTVRCPISKTEMGEYAVAKTPEEREAIVKKIRQREQTPASV